MNRVVGDLGHSRNEIPKVITRGKHGPVIINWKSHVLACGPHVKETEERGHTRDHPFPSPR